jgi:TolB-like protein/tetratricopeptide (TPR) repeat protein
MGGLTDGTKGAAEDRLSVLLRRVKDHRIAQWAVGYVAVAYGIQHAVTLTSEAFKWPDSIIRISMLLLALGLPLAITLAWYHGGKANHRISGPELSILSVLLVGVSILFYAFVRPSPESLQAAAPIVQEASVTTARAAAASPKGAVSVAVLPFLDLSPGKDQEFFSDGMTEEITAALAKVPDLRVVARTSAFEFKGKNVNIKTMGQELGATHLIEGSVRKAGNRVRITAQLIKADDGTHIWAEDYDRELTDVFAIQEDIARAITASLHMTLGLKPGENLVSSRSSDTKSYEDYLHAKALFRSRGVGAPQAESLLAEVVARDPDYASAWALLAEVYSHVPNFDPAFRKGSVLELSRVADAALQKVRTTASRTIQLDPRNADADLALGYAEESHGLWLDAEQSFKQALALDPLNPDALNWYSEFLGATGRVREAVAIRQRLREVEPLVPVFNANTAAILWVAGENDKALSVALTMPPGNFRGLNLARIYAAMGRTKEAADAILSMPPDAGLPGTLDAAAQLLSMGSVPAAAEKLPHLGELSFVYLYTAHPELALEFSEHEVDGGWFPAHDVMLLSQADFAHTRNSVRFKDLVRKAGLVDYWRARGWPELCHPTTGDDFECS